MICILLGKNTRLFSALCAIVLALSTALFGCSTPAENDSIDNSIDITIGDINSKESESFDTDSEVLANGSDLSDADSDVHEKLNETSEPIVEAEETESEPAQEQSNSEEQSSAAAESLQPKPDESAEQSDSPSPESKIIGKNENSDAYNEEDSSDFAPLPDYGSRISDDPLAADCGFSVSAEDEVIAQINALREALGASPLELNSSLTSGARIRAKEMFDYDYFAHERPDGASWQTVFYNEITLTGCTGIGENLAKVTNGSPDADYLMELCETSPTHYDNMIKADYTHVGVGVFTGTYPDGTQYVYAAVEFGIFK